MLFVIGTAKCGNTQIHAIRCRPGDQNEAGMMSFFDYPDTELRWQLI